jgi:ubiquinone/menaquinone biosynthesis C-methylase UbiE
MATDELPKPKPRFFDLWSRVYDASAVQRAIYRPVHDAVVKRLRAAGPATVLDVGCGTGILSARVARDLAARVIGCDFSAGMLEQAAARTRDVTWVQGDAMHLPVRPSSVDAVLSTESFHWFPDPDAALGEFARVLRPGGSLLVALVNTRTAPGSRVLETGSRTLGQPAHWPTRGEMRRRVEAAGFAVVEQHRVVRIGGVVIPTVMTVAIRR